MAGIGWAAMLIACSDPRTDPSGDRDGSGGAAGLDGGSSGGSGGFGGRAGGGCIWPNDRHPVRGAGFEAYEGVTAVAAVRSYQICPPPTTDRARIRDGRFDLLATGYGSPIFYLDLNDDGIYQTKEPDCHVGDNGVVTLADLDAVRDLHVDIVGVPAGHEMDQVHLALCNNADAVLGPGGGVACGSFGLRTVGDTSTLDTTMERAKISWAVWFAPPGAPSFERHYPHRVGGLAEAPCTVDGDLTTCSISFRSTSDAGSDAMSDAPFDVAGDSVAR